MMVRKSVVGLVVLMLGMTLAPDGTLGLSAQPTPVVRDSAGISIIENPASPGADVEARGWRVSSEPLVRIGSLDGADITLFDGVSHGAVLDDGRILVANTNPTEVRVFSRDGEPLLRFGERGQGPGEFAFQISQLSMLTEDSVALLNGTLNVHVYTIEGDYVRSISGPPGLSPGTAAWLGDDRYLVRTGRPAAPTRQYGVFRIPTTYAMWDGSTGESTTLLTVPGTEQFRSERMEGPPLILPLGASWADTVCRERLYLAETSTYSIHVFSNSGTLLQVIRKDHDPLPVSASDREWAYEEALESPMLSAPLPPSMLENQRRQVEEMPIPTVHPAFAKALHCDELGFLWVLRSSHHGSPSMTWDIFDDSGLLHAVVQMPRIAEILDIGPDYVLAVQRDELDVEYVELYGLER